MDYRHELKYEVNDFQMQLIKARLLPIMQMDKHQNGDYYTITSLYFDDVYNSCMAENISGTDRRNKYRIRMYDHRTSLIHLEKKIKFRGMTRKESIQLKLQDCEKFVKGKIPFPTEKDTDERKILLSEMTMSGMQPKIIVEYDRTAFVCPQGNVRITFDRNVRSSMKVADFLKEHTVKQPVMLQSNHILEIKYDEFLPEYISDVISIGMLKRATYSKYYRARKGGIIL